MFISGMPEWVNALFLALSTGTFIYVAGSEVIVEEFAVTKHKWAKYILYLIGGLFISGLTIWEIAGGHEH